MFPGYAKISDQVYREVYGIDFEQFKVGYKFIHRPGVTLSQDDNKNEALGTCNNAQVHYDACYVAQTEWKKCLVVSTLTSQRLMGMTWKTFARKVRIEGFKSIAMVHPVYGGDTLYAESEILAILPSSEQQRYGRLLVETRGFNQDNTCVAKLQYVIQIYRKGLHPYYEFITEEVQEERFSAYKTTPNGYMEQTGLYFEDLNPGETFQHFPSRTIYQAEALEHAFYSLEWNPKYLDQFYHQQYMNGGALNPVPELFFLTTTTTQTTKTLGKVVANLEWKNIEFVREVFPNESFHSTSKIIDKRLSKSRPEQGIVTVTTKTFDQVNSLVVSYDRVLLVYKKGAGPYAHTNYC
ncbi:MAG: hypothetical protein QM528_08340 [Phycisphaerales bacterium]|nr:hypothetical protein [Phycisphaerales bacterium]